MPALWRKLKKLDVLSINKEKFVMSVLVMLMKGGRFWSKSFGKALFAVSLLLSAIYSSTIFAVQMPKPSCDDYFKSNYPMTEFRLIGQGAAIDKRTNLTWFRCNAGEYWHSGQCRGSSSTMNWQDAHEYAKSFKGLGHSDWRLPTTSELKGLVESSCTNPSINPYVFPTVKAEIYWTSDDNFFNRYLAWGIFMFNGNDFGRHSKQSEYAVLLVRDP